MLRLSGSVVFKLLGLALLVSFTPSVLGIDVINTVGGNGANSNLFASGVAATSAPMTTGDGPGIAIDSSGNIYYGSANMIHKITASTGIVTTVAGTGQLGSSGDGGPALQASFDEPRGLFVDSSNNIYIADSKNNRVRFVNAANGVISTIAGDGFKDACGQGRYTGDNGPATAASLNKPEGIFVDGSGNLFIADSNNSVIREVVKSTGNMITFAGNGTNGFGGDGGAATSAILNNPTGVFGVGSNIYIADTNNGRIRFVSSGMISTLAGTNVIGFAGDGAAATSAQLSGDVEAVFVDSSLNVYIADSGNSRIRMVSAATSNITTIAGNGTFNFSGDGGPAVNASLSSPKGVVVDVNGNVYALDTNNSRIRLISKANGIISTFGGDGLGGFSGDGGAATSASIGIDEGGVFVDAANNIFFTDNVNCRIRKIDTSGNITTVAGTSTMGNAGDGGPATQAQLQFPEAVVFDGAGNMFIADMDRVRKVNTSGIISTFAGGGNNFNDGIPATQAQFSDLRALAIDGGGNLLISDQSRIRKVDNTGTITTIAGTSGSGVGGQGDGGPAANATFCNITGLFFDSVGNLLIVDAKNNRVRKIDKNGIVSAVAGTGAAGFSGDGGPATIATFNQPYGVVADALGNVYITDSGNQRIRKVDPSGNISTIAGTGALGFSGDGGNALNANLAYPFAIGGRGNTGVFLDVGNQRVRSVTHVTVPTITSLSASLNPAQVNENVTFTANAINPNGLTLSFAWNFNDGTGVTSNGNSITHAFAAGGTYNVVCTVSDPFQTGGNANLSMNILAPSSGGAGVQNVATGAPPVVNPLNGISISVTSSQGGVVELAINIDALNRAAFDVSTDFAGLSTVHGLTPVNKFNNAGIFPATSSATDLATGLFKGKARKMLVVSRKETGESPLVTVPPPNPQDKQFKVTLKRATGKFALAGAAAATAAKPDIYSFQGTIELPAGLDVSKPQELQIGIGNIVDVVTLDAKGRGTTKGALGRIKSVSLKYPHLKGSTVTASGQNATLSVTFSAVNMVSTGFDTEGVSAKPASSSLSIQFGMLLAGVPYQFTIPATIKVSNKNTLASLSSSSR